MEQATHLLGQQNLVLECYLTLLDLTLDAIIVTAPDDTILFWNKTACQLYGWTREEAVGRTTRQLFGAEFVPNTSGNDNLDERCQTQERWRGGESAQPLGGSTGSRRRPNVILFVNQVVA